MFSSPFRRRRQEQKIDALYGAIVAQARRPAFYVEYGVADTVTGRFDMIVLHLALVLRRLREAPESERPLGQGLFDAFCNDLDGNLREMGVGDLKVPKEMRRFGEAFYGRAAAYDRALAAIDPAELAATLARNVFAQAEHPDAVRLAAYVREAERALASPAWMTQGQIPFPDPAAVQAAQQPGPAGH
jgi:cytochrome b pre-mRNA-processing protein 3